MTEETTEETTVSLPKGITQEQYDEAKGIVLAGYENKDSADVIKTTMFTAGIPFSNLVRLFKAISINEGLVVAPAIINKGIEEVLSDLGDRVILDENGVMAYEELESLAKHTVENVSGCTIKKAMKALRTRLAELDIDAPKKPKKAGASKGAAGKVNIAIVDFFAANAAGTAEEFSAAMSKVTTEKSLKKWNRMYKLFSALAQGKDSEALK